MPESAARRTHDVSASDRSSPLSPSLPPALCCVLLLLAGCPSGPTSEDGETAPPPAAAPAAAAPIASPSPTPREVAAPRRSGRAVTVSVEPPPLAHTPTEAGRAAWADVLGYGPAPSKDQLAVVDTLLGLYGRFPHQLGPTAVERLKRQAADGAVDAIAKGEPVDVDVYPDEMRFVADKLGWRDPAQRRERHQELLDLTARLVLEFGPLHQVDEKTWYAIERSVRVGDSQRR